MFNENHQEDYDVEEWSVEKDIKRKQRISRRGKKHVKDNTRKWRDSLGVTRLDKHLSMCGCYHCMVANDVEVHETLHKHKRAERVYTSEECEEYFSYSEWFDHEGYHTFHHMVDDCRGECIEGSCMSCDWGSQSEGLGWDDSNFIEFWDYEEYWLEDVYKPRETVNVSCGELDRKHTSQMCNIKLYLLRACLKEGG